MPNQKNTIKHPPEYGRSIDLSNRLIAETLDDKFFLREDLSAPKEKRYVIVSNNGKISFSEESAEAAHERLRYWARNHGKVLKSYFVGNKHATIYFKKSIT